MEVRTFGGAVWEAWVGVIGKVLNVLPELLGAAVLLVLGWTLSGVIGRLLARGVRASGLERAIEHSAAGEYLRGSGSRWTVAGVIGGMTTWAIRLLFLQAAASMLAMPQLTAVITALILFIPNVLVAVGVLIVGVLLAGVAGGAIRAAAVRMGVVEPDRPARMARVAVVALSVIGAISQLGIAPVIVHTLFIGAVGALALAVGLAFGLGGREVAAELTREWLGQGQRIVGAEGEEIHPRPHRPEPH